MERYGRRLQKEVHVENAWPRVPSTVIHDVRMKLTNGQDYNSLVYWNSFQTLTESRDKHSVPCKATDAKGSYSGAVGAAIIGCATD